MRVVAIWLLLTIPVFASEICRTVDISPWTQSQRNLLAAVSSELVDEAGSPSRITRWSNQTGEVCFDTPTVDLAIVLTETAILNRYTSDEAIRQSNADTEAIRQQGFTDEITSNNLCTAELSELTNRIDTWVANRQAEVNAATNLAQVKTVLRDQVIPQIGTALKQVARCLRARSR